MFRDRSGSGAGGTEMPSMTAIAAGEQQLLMMDGLYSDSDDDDDVVAFDVAGRR